MAREWGCSLESPQAGGTKIACVHAVPVAMQSGILYFVYCLTRLNAVPTLMRYVR